MNKLINIILLPFKILYFIIILPFKIISFIIKVILNALSFIWNKFLSLFKFSLSFKISFFYLLTIGFTLFIMIATILFGFKFYLNTSIPLTIKHDNDAIITFLDHNSEIEINELKMYLSDNNKIEISKNNIKIFSTTPKRIMNSPSHTNLDFLNLNTLMTEKNIYYKNYSITISPYLFNYLLISNALLIFLIVISAFALVIIIVIGNNINKKMFEPIKTMSNSAKKITGNNLKERINVSNSYDELKDLGETFNEMMDRIEISYQKQKQFVNDASHELRTPIAVIQGYSNMLYRWGKKDEKILDESITAIREESENMKTLVNSLLFLARADKNENKLIKTNFLINDLLEDLTKENKVIDSKHNFKMEIEENLIIQADRNLLKQALRIFIQNSIKYTKDNGTITLKSYSRDNNIIVDISDTGIGIPKDDLSKIFDRFYRTDQSRTREMGGTGLGLSIAKSIITLHNGKIKIRSKVNVGTDIRLILPYK